MAKNIATQPQLPLTADVEPYTGKLPEDASTLPLTQPSAEAGLFIEVRTGKQRIYGVVVSADAEGVVYHRHEAYKGIIEEDAFAPYGVVFGAQQACTHCKDILAMAEFPRNKNIKDGHHAICKLCDKGKVEAAARGEEFIPESRYHVEDGTNKQCSKCKQWKWEEDFNVDRSRPDGLTSQCKGCRRAARRAR